MNISFTLTSELILSLKKLDNAYARAFASLKATSDEELASLHKYARVSIIGASTRIENAMLTDSEVNWIDTILTADGKLTAFDQNRTIIEDKLSKDRERSIEEVAGCRSMLMLLYTNPDDFFPIKESDLRALHYELMSPYKKAKPYAGKYKILSNSVIEQNDLTNEKKVVFQTSDPGPITSAAMHDLVSWYNTALPLASWPIAVSAEFVYRFLAIHPFQDGNGRLGRALFLLSLLNSKSETISFVSNYTAIDRYIEKHKEEYYFVLNRCSDGKFETNPQKYRIEYFLKFMIKVLYESIQGIELYKKKFRAESRLSNAASIVLACFREHPEIRLTTAKVIQQTNLPRRTIVYALNNLLDSSLIQRSGQGSATRYQLAF